MRKELFIEIKDFSDYKKALDSLYSKGFRWLSCKSPLGIRNKLDIGKHIHDDLLKYETDYYLEINRSDKTIKFHKFLSKKHKHFTLSEVMDKLS